MLSIQQVIETLDRMAAMRFEAILSRHGLAGAWQRFSTQFLPGES